MNDFALTVRDALMSWDLPRKMSDLADKLLIASSLPNLTVRGFGWDEDPWEPTATVSGEVHVGVGVARCHITFGRQHKFAGALWYRIDCACPQNNCIHAAALLVEAQRRENYDAATSEFEAWAKQLASTSARPLPTDRDNSDANLRPGLIITAIRPEHGDHDDALYVRDQQPMALVLLEPPTGRSRRPKKLSASSDNHPRIDPSQLDTFARLRLAAIPAHPAERSDSTVIIVGTALAESAFEQVLAAGGVYFEKVAGDPARRGEDFIPSFEWEPIDDETQALHIILPNGQRPPIVMKLHHTWYVTGDGTMGRLEGSPERLLALARAPTIANEDIATISAKWRSIFPDKSIPAPVKQRPVEDVRANPTGMVRIALSPQDGGSVPTAALTFMYGEHEMRGSDFADMVAQRTKGKKRFAIHRYPAEEMNLIDKLTSAGFVNAADHPLLRGVYRRTDDVYVTRPSNGALDDIDSFLHCIDLCEAAGFNVVFDADIPFGTEASPATYAQLSEGADNTPGADWFDLDLGIEWEGKRHSLVEVVSATLADYRFQLKPTDNESPDARWTVRLASGERLRIPIATLRQLIAPIVEWLDVEESVHKKQIRVPRLHAALLANDTGIEVPSSLVDLRATLVRLGNLATEPLPAEPAGFNGILRPYQREGLRWLNVMAAAGLGAILADDMGLGKTPQLIAHLMDLKSRGELTLPVLIVVTKSLVGNWLSEISTFAPSLRTIALVGNVRPSLIEQIPKHDIAITTYNLLPRDVELILAHRFALVVTDEAQNVKNPSAQAVTALNSLSRGRAIALTGTPVENHPIELWSQFNQVIPGYFGTRARFTRAFATPIAKRDDDEAKARLSRRAAPFILRRTKEQVATDLPPKTETTIRLSLEGEQRALYESLRVAQLAQIQSAIAERGLKKSGTVVLTALLKLRQACCDPRLTKLSSAARIQQSIKLEAFMDIVREAVSEGRRILVFSVFEEMIKLISKRLDEEDFDHLCLTGQTENRDVAVRKFQGGSVPLFLLTLKAGGVGLNLTAADTVIHYDPWWNPAAEDQATDRAHRIGQDRPVMVYRLICEGTVEEKMEDLKKRKAAMAEAILSGAMSGDLPTTDAGIEELLALI